MDLMKREQREAEWHKWGRNAQHLYREVQQLVIQSHNNARLRKREDEEKTSIAI